MNKKGFTLIELLAVIVIMAILALILVPIISNVIDSARKAAFRETVNGIIESANNYVGEYVLINYNDPTYPIEIYCNGNECEDSNGKKLEFKGKVPISGKVILESSNVIRADLISDGVYCGSGTKGNVEVYSKCSELDHTNPIIDESKLNDIVISTTTNTLTLSMPIDLMYDDETGISRYDIDLYLGNNKVASKEFTEPNIIFEGLKSDTEYKVVITGVNGNNGKTSIDRTATTLDITKPTISYTNDPVSDVNGYFRSQTLNVTYTKGNVENPEYYIRSGRAASTNINVIGSCGNGTNPSECSSIDISNIEADIWYKVSGNINVVYNVNASTESSLTAIIYDGVNYEGSDTKIIAKIEETPIAPTITGGSNDWTTTSRTISVATAGDAFTEVSKYQYYISTSNSSQTDGSWQDVSGTSVTVSTEGTHYVFFRTVSTAGYTSAASNAETVKVESTLTAPTITGGNNNYTNSSRTISVSNAGSATTGVSKYQYYISTASNSQTGGSWQDVSGTSVAVSTEGVHYVFFRTVSTAGFTSSASSGATVKVDKTGPTAPTAGSIGSVSGSNSTGTIATAASGSTDSGVGGITYKYLVTNSSSAPAKTNTGFTTSRNFTRSCGKTYYGWAIAEDSLGNRSDVRSLGHTADGANSYSGWSACSKTCGGGTQTRTNSCALVTTGFSQSCNTQSCCSYAANQQVFGVETAGGYSFTVASGCTGTYKLTVYGAQGGSITATGTWEGYSRNYTAYGGYGGYAYGNIKLTAGTTIYIYVGGQASAKSSVHSGESISGGSGGYNGGGNATHTGASGGGGGATHIATTNRGVLSNYNSYRGEVIIVAGGGGGAAYGARGWCGDCEWQGSNIGNTGGSGGGTNGGQGGYLSGLQVSNDTGGTQSSGGSGGGGNGSFCQGATPNYNYEGGAGGGGWFGGGAGGNYNGGVAGSGGSGYLSSYLISGTTGMLNGQKTGNGAAYITFIGLN